MRALMLNYKIVVYLAYDRKLEMSDGTVTMVPPASSL